jgi:hypothetical protein
MHVAIRVALAHYVPATPCLGASGYWLNRASPLLLRRTEQSSEKIDGDTRSGFAESVWLAEGVAMGREASLVSPGAGDRKPPLTD